MTCKLFFYHTLFYRMAAILTKHWRGSAHGSLAQRELSAVG